MRSTVLAFLLLSARGGVAALAAWLVCRALRRAHAPSRLLCWLWLAVGLRFVLPWGIPLKLPRPESAPLAAAADTVQELGELPLLPPAPAAAAAAAPLPWYARLTPWHALAAVWLVGVLVLAVRGAVGYLKLKRCVALACKTPDGCYGGACVPTPFTLGFVRPRVYLPDSLQGPARQAVLLHERTHIRRRDPLVKPLFYAVVCLHWFNPLAWLALCAFEHDMEAACDEAAVQGCTLAERSTYCESLLQFAMQGRPIRTPGSLAFGQGSVKERIVHLLHYRRLGAGALALCAVAVGVSVTACMVPPAGGSVPRRDGAARRYCRDCKAYTRPHRGTRHHARRRTADIERRRQQSAVCLPGAVQIHFPLHEQGQRPPGRRPACRRGHRDLRRRGRCCAGRTGALQLGQFCGDRPRYRRRRAALGHAVRSHEVLRRCARADRDRRAGHRVRGAYRLHNRQRLPF